MTNVDDLTLMAYVDGELDAETARSVEAKIQQDPAARRKVRLLRESAALVHSCANEPVHDPVPYDFIRTPGGSGSDRTAAVDHARRRWLAAAGIAALVAGSFGAGYFLKGAVPGFESEATADEELVDEIVAYHAFYAAQPGIVSERSDRMVMAHWLSQHMHQAVRIPDLSHSGFRFETARLFLYEDKPIAQIVYQSPSGVPVALCIVASSEAGARPFEALHRAGFTLIVWRRNGSTYVVISALPQARLQQLSAEISTDL